MICEIKKIGRTKYFRQAVLIAIDLLIVFFCTWVSLLMRFSWSAIPPQYEIAAIRTLPVDMILTLVVFWSFRLYHSVWSYASINELIRIFKAVTVLIVVEICYKMMLSVMMPRSVYFMVYISMLVLVTMSRMSIRILKYYLEKRRGAENRRTRIMIVGAGSAGATLLTELSRNSSGNANVVCMVDDNSSKWGKYLHGVPIEGGRDDILRLTELYEIEEILIAMPSASQNNISDVVDICSRTDCRVRILPSIVSSLEGNISSNLRNISYEDLLSRDPVDVNDAGIDEYIENKVVLVTGGGGSIGSELCRQIAKRRPGQLIILDVYENNAYEIQMELRNHYQEELDVRTVIASVRDYDRMDCVFARYRPDIVFHAAAHKHVPLMEQSPNEAIKNNVKGTLNTAMLADRYHAHKFILISTDKAVRPTNIMGASKRICEMIIQDFAKKSDTVFGAVRFGNVLGSNGSVIPLFLRQIDEGGPVTVTHREITRFFMTIPEAVSLVLQAGAYASDGEIFVLDMGKQVNIYDLAVSLIKMRGYRPNKDIEIRIIGLRPGEKLYEEVLMDEEGLSTTGNRLIHIGKPIEMDYKKFEESLHMLIAAADDNVNDIKERTREICDTYTIYRYGEETKQ